mmetsp:Transcript_23934/g.36619  ORF Transcript_23934/g.36619 Transcript_23934/m.36619 type:complete len:352 (+) Transcript_23934:205-1260(+)
MEAHFIKIEGDDITPENIKQKVVISSIKQDAMHSLYALISKIYVPLIREKEKEKDQGEKNNQLRDLLFSLRAGLHSHMRKAGPKHNLQKVTFTIDQFRGVLVPMDEIEVWQELENDQLSTDNEKMRKNAIIINRHLAPIEKFFREFQTASLSSITGQIGNIEDCLSNIWTDPDIFPPYPQDRMRNFFKVISKVFGSRIEKEFKENDVWAVSFSDVRLRLNECMRICAKWKESMSLLTKFSWRQKMAHQWEGQPYLDTFLETLMKRMNEIFELRSQHDELLRLLSSEEQKEMNVESFFEPFRETNAFYINEVLLPHWLSTKKRYENSLEPVEKKICSKLRKEIFQEQSSTPT